jgi:hypothetical protein
MRVMLVSAAIVTDRGEYVTMRQAQKMGMMRAEMFATLRAGVFIPPGKRCLADGASQFCPGETHSFISFVVE